MVRTSVSRILVCAILASLAVVLTAMDQPALAADGAGPVKKTLARRGRRLPPHYAPVVTEEQKEKIYKIQEEYQPKIDALKANLEALKKELAEKKKELAEKTAAVLTPEQKQKIDDATGKTKEKGKEKPTEPAEKPSSPPPAKQEVKQK